MYIHGQNPPDRSGWGQISDQFDLNDCDNSVLNAYPEPRRFFCIDHGMGQVMVSSRFSVPAVQTTYTIQVDVSPDGATKFRQEYNVTYFKTHVTIRFFYTVTSSIIMIVTIDSNWALSSGLTLMQKAFTRPLIWQVQLI